MEGLPRCRSDLLTAMPISFRNARHFARRTAFIGRNQRLERVLQTERIVAIGLLTRRDLTLLGPAFDRAWPVEEAPNFSELLRAIDEADRKLRQSQQGDPSDTTH